MEWRFGPVALAALAAFAVAACGGPTAVASHSPTPHQQPSPSADPTPAASSEPPRPPPPTPSPSPSAAVLSCHLPISNGQPGSGGFVVFPGGKFVADPVGSNVVITGIPTPSPGPYGYFSSNFFTLTYDRRYSKWLPVPRSMVTPDETRYVFSLSDGVRVRNVGNGATAVLAASAGHPWTILDVESEGVYANPVPNSQQAISGVWLLPFSGAARQVTSRGYWQLLSRGVAYGYMAPSVPAGATQSLMKLDLKTGAIAQWYADLPQNTNLLGLDVQGRPIVLFQVGVQQVAVLTGSNQLTTIYDGSSVSNSIYITSGIADSSGIWLASGDGLYLSRGATAPIEKVSEVTGPIGGPCV